MARLINNNGKRNTSAKSAGSETAASWLSERRKLLASWPANKLAALPALKTGYRTASRWRSYSLPAAKPAKSEISASWRRAVAGLRQWRRK